MAINIYAKQVPGIEIGRMDVATLLSFMNTVVAKGAQDTTMTTKLGDVWTAFVQSANNYDLVYNPSRKDLLTDVLKNLDDVRDKAQGAWHVAILAALKSPNQPKQWIAQQLVQFYKDYNLDVSQEYMKQSTNISQMIQAIEGNADIMAALPIMGLDDFLNDLKAKNNAFLAKMDERTTGTIGAVSGTVAAARNDVEHKYRTFVRITNVINTYEGNGVLDQFILVITAEIEHYRQILARKGVSTGSGGSNSGGNTASPNPSEGGTASPDPSQGGENEGGGASPDPSQGGENGGGGDNGGGGGGDLGDMG